MGRPNCTRSLAYCTAVSRQTWAPPTCSAAKATAARSSTRSRTAHPPPSVPTRAADTPSNSRRACLRVMSMVAKAVRVRPSASPSTRNSDTPPGVRAATSTRSAMWPSSTYILVPVRVQPSPSAVASMAMPASSHFPLSSVKASVAMVDPEAMPGSRSARASSSPEWMSVLAANTTVEKNGAHSSARPISSMTTMSST